MKAIHIHENILFENPSTCTRSLLVGGPGCSNSKLAGGCKEAQNLMKEYYMEDGIFLIDETPYYSIWAYKNKFKNRFQETLRQLSIEYLKGKRSNYVTYDFIFNSNTINNIDTKIIKENFEVPFAISRRDMYKELDSYEDLRDIFSLEYLEKFYSSYYEYVHENLDIYVEGLEKYLNKIK